MKQLTVITGGISCPLQVEKEVKRNKVTNVSINETISLFELDRKLL